MRRAVLAALTAYGTTEYCIGSIVSAVLPAILTTRCRMPRSGEIGEQISEQVEKLVAGGMNRSEAFAKISADTGRRAGTVAANYYRVARKRAVAHCASRGPPGAPRAPPSRIDQRPPPSVSRNARLRARRTSTPSRRQLVSSVQALARCREEPGRRGKGSSRAARRRQAHPRIAPRLFRRYARRRSDVGRAWHGRYGASLGAHVRGAPSTRLQPVAGIGQGCGRSAASIWRMR